MSGDFHDSTDRAEDQTAAVDEESLGVLDDCHPCPIDDKHTVLEVFVKTLKDRNKEKGVERWFTSAEHANIYLQCPNNIIVHKNSSTYVKAEDLLAILMPRIREICLEQLLVSVDNDRSFPKELLVDYSRALAAKFAADRSSMHSTTGHELISEHGEDLIPIFTSHKKKGASGPYVVLSGIKFGKAYDDDMKLQRNLNFTQLCESRLSADQSMSTFIYCGDNMRVKHLLKLQSKTEDDSVMYFWSKAMHDVMDITNSGEEKLSPNETVAVMAEKEKAGTKATNTSLLSAI